MIARRLRVVLSKLRAPWRSSQGDREFDEEIEAHLARLAERFVRNGMSPDEAKSAARRQFGNVTCLRESRHDMLTFASVHAFLSDLRYGARGLARSPGWTTVAVLTLALGIGANIAIFSLVRPILLAPLPYPDPGRLVVASTVFMRYNDDRGPVSFADVLDWRRARDTFERVTAYFPSSADLTEGDEPERVRALVVDDDYFRVMGTPPLAGRFFTAEENLPNGPNVVVLGHALWVRRYAADPAAVGRTIELRGVPYRIVGITRPESTWPADAEIFLTAGTGGQPNADLQRRDNHIFLTLARLRPAVSIEQAQARLAVMAAVVARQAPNRSETTWKIHALSAYIVGPAVGRTLVVLFGAVLFVLLIACVNVTNLLLARGSAREREVAIRAALGAGWRRIAAQFLAETALLSAAGGVAGLFAGYWALKTLVRFAPSDVPRLEHARVETTTLLFALGLCVATTILASLGPAWRAARVAPGRSFQAAGRSLSGSRQASRLRSGLVIVELALAIVLLAGAGLMIRSLGQMQRVDPGMRLANVVTMQTSLPRARYATPAHIVDGFEKITAAIGRVPGVVRASASTSLPLGGGGAYLGRVHLREGQPEPPASSDTFGSWSVVQPDYFGTMGIPILDGRAFSMSDTSESTPVAIISRSMAREMFPDGRAVGRRIRSWRDENKYREIVGVVGDLRYNGLTNDIVNNLYVPHTQSPARSLVLVVRTAVDPAAAIPAIRTAIRSIDKKLPLAEVRTLEQILDRNLSRPRFSMFLLGLFGVGAVVLAAIGTYGVIAYNVSQRTRELGIRMALGAARTRVVGMVVWHAAMLGAVAVVAGLAGAFVLTRVIKSLLFEVSPTDPLTFASTAALLLLVALVAASAPAWRAARVDPAMTLRCE